MPAAVRSVKTPPIKYFIQQKPGTTARNQNSRTLVKPKNDYTPELGSALLFQKMYWVGRMDWDPRNCIESPIRHRFFKMILRA